MKLSIGDSVIYGGDGVCEITDIENMEMSGKIREYYVLAPVFNKSMKIYVPVDNRKSLQHIRYALTGEQAKALIDDMPSMETIWINNEHMRKEEYRKIIGRADLRELVSLIKTLYLKRLEREEKGKKLYACDEVFLSSAEKLLYGEIAAAMGIERDEVAEYIARHIEEKKA